MNARPWQLATAVTALAGVGLTGYVIGASGASEVAPVRTIELDVEGTLGDAVPPELNVTDRSPDDRGIVPANVISAPTPASVESPDDDSPASSTPSGDSSSTSSGTSRTTIDDSPDSVDSPASIDS